MFFSQEFYALGHPHKKLYSFPFFSALLHRPYLEVAAAEQMQLIGIIQSIEQEHAGQLAQKNDMLRDYLDILLILLMRQYQAQNTTNGIILTGLAQWHDLESLVDQHYREHKPVSFYAEKLHLTAKQLNDTGKRIMGKTITELVQDRVLLEARRLLVHSHLTVSQVAAELGYFDNSYFSRFFKKHIGQTPEQFRAANK